MPLAGIPTACPLTDEAAICDYLYACEWHTREAVCRAAFSEAVCRAAFSAAVCRAAFSAAVSRRVQRGSISKSAGVPPACQNTIWPVSSADRTSEITSASAFAV
jgi:hypothetical protein